MTVRLGEQQGRTGRRSKPLSIGAYEQYSESDG